MKGRMASALLQAGALSVWASPLHAAVCDFGDFELEINPVGNYLQVIDPSGRQEFQPVMGEPGFWFAISFSDHGKEAAYLAAQDTRVVLTVHSIGQLVVSETFQGVCDEPIVHRPI